MDATNMLNLNYISLSQKGRTCKRSLANMKKCHLLWYWISHLFPILFKCVSQFISFRQKCQNMLKKFPTLLNYIYIILTIHLNLLIWPRAVIYYPNIQYKNHFILISICICNMIYSTKHFIKHNFKLAVVWVYLTIQT